MAYETRYKERVLEYLSSGHSYAQTSTQFKVSTDTIQRWKRQYAEHGCFIVKKRNRPAKKLPVEALRKYVEENPDAYLSEIGEHFSCSAEAVRQRLKTMKITRKKRR